SGSGKTVVSHFLEDLGYYRIDNLPTKLISYLIGFWERKEVEIQRIALVVDIREAGFTVEFPKALKAISQVVSPRIIFLESSDDVLVQRYSESRRPHPLKNRKSILEKIHLERERLAGIKKMADEVIDTSDFTISELRKYLDRKFSARKNFRMQVLVISFGYKYGLPLESDLIFDARFIPNPFYLEELKGKTGKSKKVKDYVLGTPESQEFLERLYKLLDYLMPKYTEEGKSNLTISIGCTGGKHRSVVLADQIYHHLKGKKHNAHIYHRDIFK
ncbi:MAG: RNase adapter RapZ, partial [Acidobacteriota bacterium]